MFKQKTRFVALPGLFLILAGSAIAQQSKDATIPGFYNPKTHTFQVKVQPAAAPETVTPKVYTGTLEFEITSTLVTAVPSGQELVCGGTAIVDDLEAVGFYTESASIVAKVTGSTATCTVKIPYSWSLGDGTADTVSLEYSLEIIPTSTTDLAAFITRTHSSELAPIKVPTTGASTPIVITATL